MNYNYSMVVEDDESTLKQEFSIKDLDDLYDVLDSLYKECRKINSISTENIDANHRKIKLSVLLPFGRYEQSSLHDIGVIERHLKRDENEVEKKHILDINEKRSLFIKNSYKLYDDIRKYYLQYHGKAKDMSFKEKHNIIGFLGQVSFHIAFLEDELSENKEYKLDNCIIYESDIRKEKLYFESDFKNNAKKALKFSEAFTLMHNVVDELINEMSKDD